VNTEAKWPSANSRPQISGSRSGVAVESPTRIGSFATVAAESIVARIKTQIQPAEIKRRLLHASPGVFPYIFYFCPQSDPLETWSLWVVTSTCVVAAIAALMMSRVFVREGERGWAISVLSFVGIVPVLLWPFPEKSEIACGVVSIIAFGDGIATFAGLMCRGRTLPWNPAKSWIGSAAFIAGSLPLAVLVFWLQTRPSISLGIAIACILPAVILAAIAESLPSRINDNIRIGIVSSVTIIVMHHLLIDG
jgi:phytol kinase